MFDRLGDALRAVVAPWAPLALGFLLLGASAEALAVDQIHIISQTGDYIGGGQEYSFTQENSTISATQTGRESVHFYVSTSGGSWRLSMAAPDGEQITTRTYYPATRLPFRGQTEAGLAVSSPGRGCNKLSGWFEVYEFSTSGSELIRFAGDLLQSCDGGPPLFATVRYNSDVPVLRPEPYAVVVGKLVAVGGEQTTLDGSASYDRASSSLQYQWVQLSGPSANIADSTAALTTASLPDVAQETEARFQLTVTDSEGYQDVNEIHVRVLPPDAARTIAYLDSSQGDWVGAGNEYFYDEFNAAIEAFQTTGGLSLGISGAEYWSANFVAPEDSSFGIGMFSGAARYPFQGPKQPGLTFRGEGRACNELSGWFDVSDWRVVGGSVQAAAIDFVQRCESGTSYLYGAIRYQSAVPLERNRPWANAGPDFSIREGDGPAYLNGNGSWSRDSQIVSVQWVQVAGPPASLEHPNQAVASFEASGIPLGGAVLRFRLTVTDQNGHQDSDDVAVSVASRSDPENFIRIDSDPTDYVGAGLEWDYNRGNADIQYAGHSGRQISVRITGETWWNLDFSGADGEALSVQAYENAQRWPFQEAGHPGLSYSGDGRGCNTLTGRFDIHQLVWNDSGDPQTLSLDFEQHCEGASAAAYGQVRLNVTPPGVPVAHAGPDKTVDVGSVVQLDGGASSDPELGALQYRWEQVAGPQAVVTHADQARVEVYTPAEWDQHVAIVMRLLVSDQDGLMAEDFAAISRIPDSDGDGVPDPQDAFPNDPSESQDSDGDGIGDNADPTPNEPMDSDGDGVPDSQDAFPADPSESQDSDGDGIGDNADPTPHGPGDAPASPDPDSEETGDNQDPAPENPGENDADLDGDGVSDNQDADDDNDGQTDAEEMAGPNGGDGNADGTPDFRQSHVANFRDGSLRAVTLEASAGKRIEAVHTIATADPAGYQMLRNWIGFRIAVPVGAAAEVAVILHGSDVPDAYLKRADDGTVEPFAFNGSTGAVIDGNRITLHLVDGGRGDADGMANGVIVDPGAPAITRHPESPQTVGGLGGSGALSTRALLWLLCFGLMRGRRWHRLITFRRIKSPGAD